MCLPCGLWGWIQLKFPHTQGESFAGCPLLQYTSDSSQAPDPTSSIFRGIVVCSSGEEAGKCAFTDYICILYSMYNLPSSLRLKMNVTIKNNAIGSTMDTTNSHKWPTKIQEQCTKNNIIDTTNSAMKLDCKIREQ